MKKVLLITVMALVSFGMNAQILSSRTVTRKKSESPITWFVKAGVSIDNATNPNDLFGDQLGSTIGFDATVGFLKPIATSSFYWGMDLGIGTRGASYKSEYNEETYKSLAWAVRYSPFTVGYRYSINDFLTLDGHLGAFLSYDFAHNDNWPSDDKFDAGIQVGAGVWFNRFNVDVMYQRGFCNAATWGPEDAHSSNVIIRLGFAF